MASQTATAVVPISSNQSVQTYSSQPSTRSAASARTPQNVSKVVKAPVVPSPGRFRHPRMTEIAKRRSATSFTSQNIVNIAVNTAALLATLVLSGFLSPSLTWIVQNCYLDQAHLDASLILTLLRLVLLSNIFFALRPVLPYISEPDTIEDIALTPSQRALIGLPRSQSDTPTSPASYITPPRYRRSSPSPFAGTPQSSASARSISANYSASPQTASRYTVGFSPTPQQQPSGTLSQSRRLSGSPFSPSSPLFNKAFYTSASRNTNDAREAIPNADFTESTRSLLAGNISTSSFQSSLRKSHSMREPGTPSPGARERKKVDVQPALNYKWLYEKGLKVGKNGNVEY